MKLHRIALIILSYIVNDEELSTMWQCGIKTKRVEALKVCF